MFFHSLTYLYLRRQVSHLLYDNVMFEAPHLVSAAPASPAVGLAAAAPPGLRTAPRRRRQRDSTTALAKPLGAAHHMSSQAKH